ncbi:MAG: amidohydrolase family protein [Alphaproteobacteria bacterium]
MRNGMKIYDTDTHVGPSAEALRPHLSSKLLQLVPNLDDHLYEVKTGWAGEKYEAPFRHRYRFADRAGWSKNKPRHLGEAGPRENEERHFQNFMGVTFPSYGGADDDSAARLRDMDTEGVDVHFIVSNGGVGHADPAIEMEFIYAQHRYLDAFCGRDPRRLKSCLTVTPLAVEASVAEIHRWGKSPWAVAVHPSLPLDYPLDHPDMNPIWEATQEQGLAVIHHSLAWGYPGYRDMWANPFIGRSGSHPWAAMRAVASFIGSGLMDRYPGLRYAVLESGFGWLPFWANRMDDQAVYVGYTAKLQHKISEYVTGGRFFASVEQHEGPRMAKHVNELLGDHILMFGSDYPHAESRFPESAERVLQWQSAVGPEAMRKMMWDNPVRFFGEP